MSGQKYFSTPVKIAWLPVLQLDPLEQHPRTPVQGGRTSRQSQATGTNSVT